MDSAEINKIGIIGAGRMGTDIFNFLIANDYKLVWICIDETETVFLQQSFEKRINRLHKCGIFDDQQLKEKLNSVLISHRAENLSDCNLIIECIWEDIVRKKQMYQHILPFLSSKCILASNSSSFLPSQLLPDSTFDERFIGLHFFYPVKLKNIVEVIKTTNTSAETIEKVSEFCIKTAKRQLVQDEKNAFWLNRLFLDIQNEAFLIHNEKNYTFEQIDAIIAEHLFPEGVFKFFDQVGIDIMLQAIRNYTADNPLPYRIMITKLEELISENKLGVKSKSGFYDYTGVNTKQGSVLIRNDYYFLVLERLTSAYVMKAQDLVNKGVCDKATLEFAAKEYMNSEQGPFSVSLNQNNQ